MKGVQCYELFGGIALKIHTFSFSFSLSFAKFPSYFLSGDILHYSTALQLLDGINIVVLFVDHCFPLECMVENTG